MIFHLRTDEEGYAISIVYTEIFSIQLPLLYRKICIRRTLTIKNEFVVLHFPTQTVYEIYSNQI